MSGLSNLERLKFEKLLGMSGGYVLDYSNRTFSEFFLENVSINIFDNKYDYASSSKANRLRAFWTIESNKIVGLVLLGLLERWKFNKTYENTIIKTVDNHLYEECKIIANKYYVNEQTKNDNHQKVVVEKQLENLLSEFDSLIRIQDHQHRGFVLQKLLVDLFNLQQIQVRKSFQRNEGGEQIDGAFEFNGWYYLVECKWTKKMVDIKELDSLMGKVNRSGKQSMGLFLSIEGWSENVPKLLKQNPEKSIILMEGYELRCVLSGQVSLDALINAKLSKLNLDSEPYFCISELFK